MKKNVIVGIDLGTTNSAIAIMENGKPKIIANAEGFNTTPSVVGFSSSGEVLVGQVAKRQAVTNSTKTVFGVKRLIGRKLQDKEVQHFKKITPYEIVAKANGDAWVKIDGKEMSPQEISARIIEKLKKAAEDYLGHEVTEAIITCPAAFSQSQREATAEAGKIAGLNVRRIINEPTAAALAYGEQSSKSNKVVVVADFGGGTGDSTCLEISGNDDGAGALIEVKASVGDTFLGGHDIDQRLIEYLVEEFKKESGVDISKDTMAMQRLQDAAEKAKHELSSVAQTDVNLPFLTADATGPKHFNLSITRAKLESLIEDLVDKMVALCKQCVEESGHTLGEVSEVILVGGTTRIPLIQKKLKEYFGKDPLKNVNPDEIVALGAAVQGGVLSGEVKDVLLLDVTPLSLGLETLGGVFTKIVEKNTTIPTKKSMVFSTATDNQPAVSIHVLQGEREMAADNRTLGRFDLQGIMPAPRGVPQIEVTFDIDASGIVHVTAKDLSNGKTADVKITAGSGLTKEEIERMVKEAELNREKDQAKRKVIEARNNLEVFINQAEKAAETSSNKEAVLSAVADAKAHLASENEAQINEAIQTLQTKIATYLNQGTTSEGQAQEGTNTQSHSPQEDAQDADFKEV